MHDSLVPGAEPFPPAVLLDGIGALEDLANGDACEDHQHYATTWGEVEDFFRFAYAELSFEGAFNLPDPSPSSEWER